MVEELLVANDVIKILSGYIIWVYYLGVLLVGQLKECPDSYFFFQETHTANISLNPTT